MFLGVTRRTSTPVVVRNIGWIRYTCQIEEMAGRRRDSVGVAG